jgi:hypothetical protein
VPAGEAFTVQVAPLFFVKNTAGELVELLTPVAKQVVVEGQAREPGLDSEGIPLVFHEEPEFLVVTMFSPAVPSVLSE